MSFTEHPLRRWAVDEMRLRRFAPVGAHCDIYQVVRLIEQDERSAEDRARYREKNPEKFKGYYRAYNLKRKIAQ